MKKLYSIQFYDMKEEAKKLLPEDAEIIEERLRFIVLKTEESFDALRKLYDGVALVAKRNPDFKGGKR